MAIFHHNKIFKYTHYETRDPDPIPQHRIKGIVSGWGSPRSHQHHRSFNVFSSCCSVGNYPLDTRQPPRLPRPHNQQFNDIKMKLIEVP